MCLSGSNRSDKHLLLYNKRWYNNHINIIAFFPFLFRMIHLRCLQGMKILPVSINMYSSVVWFIALWGIKILPIGRNIYNSEVWSVALWFDLLFNGNVIHRFSLSEAMSEGMEELRKENESLRKVIKMYKVRIL